MIEFISVDKIHPHENNPRKDLGDLTELSASIKESGVLQNLTVIPCTGYYFGDYTVIIGHRRLAAAKLAGLTEVPCVVTEMDEKKQIATMLLENMQRSDLTVYEQAQGIQMMLDLGESVEGISEKTGFSESTVRRRVKLLTLDKDKFSGAEMRGGTLDDYIKVTEITDEKTRNKVTDAIGTANFEWELRKAMKEQLYKETLPLIKKEMKKIGALENKSLYSWSGGYDVVISVSISEFKEGCIEKKAKSGKEYWWNVYNENTVYLFEKKPKQKKEVVKKSKKEIKAIEARKELKAVSQMAYDCRKEFISEFASGKKNADIITEWIWELLYKRLCGDYLYPDWEILCEKIGEKNERNKYRCERENLDKYINEKSSNAPVVIAAALSGGKKDETYYYEGYGESMPTHKKNENLDFLYKYLCKLGYEMSDEEKALQDGTHELFKNNDR